MESKELIQRLSRWAHTQTTKIENRTLVLEAGRKTLKTDEEHVHCLLELSELSGYAKAMVELQRKLLEEVQNAKTK